MSPSGKIHLSVRKILQNYFDDFCFLWSLTAVSNTDNCNKTHCDMSLTYANSISPCTLYTVGDAHNKVINVTTLPGISYVLKH